jgi:predicted nucleic acid-binding protein
MAHPNGSGMIHLDTSFLIRSLLAGSREGAALDRWLTSGESVGISSVSWCEFLCGPVGAPEVTLAATLLGPPTPFLPEDAAVAASLFNMAGRRRGSLPDCMIAGVAIRAGAQIATNNIDDFRRFIPQGLILASI